MPDEKIKQVLEKWHDDPVAFIQDVWPQSNVWGKLQEVCYSVRDHFGTVVPSAHGVGKTWVLARIVLWWLFTRIPSKVITTAPTWAQIESVLWGEIKTALLTAKFPLCNPSNILNTEIKLQPDWFAKAISTTEQVELREFGSTKLQGFHCLSDDTDVLTDSGWKTIFELQLKVKVMSVPVGKRKGEWKEIQKIWSFLFHGELNVLEEKVMNFAVTDEHRFPTKYDSESKKWELKKFSETKGKFVIQRIVNQEGGEITVPEEFKEFDDERFCEFVRFWTGDGGTREHSSGRFYEVILYQVKKEGVAYLEDKLLCGLKYSRTQDYFSFSDRRKVKWLIENVGRYQLQRKVPDFIKKASNRIRMAYLRGLWEAEGSIKKNKKWGQIYNTSKRLMDDVQEMLFLMGRPSTLGINKKIGQGIARNDCYVLSFTEKVNDYVVFKKKIRRQKYHGTVWCLSTEYQTFVVRRKGRIFVSGNSPNLLVVLDEAPGVPQFIYTAVASLAMSGDNRIIKVGNPTSPTGEFFNNCYSNQWNKVHISGFDHPNIVAGMEIIPGAITKAWIDRQKEEWGEGSPLWKAKVLGDFPDETEDTLIPLSWCEFAVSVEVESNTKTVLGVDSARFGDDKSVAYEIRANIAKLVYEVQKEDTMMQSGRVSSIHENYEQIGIDGTGVGGGLIDRVKEILNSSLNPEERKGHKIIEIHFGGKPTQKERFFDLRAEMYYTLRERLRPDGPTWMKIQIPNDNELKNQLASLKIQYTSDGRIKIESKDDMKKRGLKSPDKADALAIASWMARGEKPEMFIQNPVYKEFYEYKRKQRAVTVADKL